MPVDIKVIASPANWIEGEAIAQLEKTAMLPGMVAAVGMPDLHPGKGTPIGAAFASEGRFYPHLVGNDIGCGMSLWDTDLAVGKLKPEKWVRKLSGLDGPWDGDTAAWLAERGVATTAHDVSLGTIGGGNHFAELQRVNTIADPEAFSALGLDKKRLTLLVHSGSRGFGERILRDHVGRFGAAGLAEGTPEAQAYLDAHAHALGWASANRALIARRFAEALSADRRVVLDVCHNSVLPIRLGECDCWLHRKGAAPADVGPVVIPGSRGTLSYLVQPTPAQADSLATLAHGAGRKWGRGETKGRLVDRFKADDFRRTPLGGWVICEDKDLLFEEAPQAYKDVDVVVGDLVDAGLVTVIATFAPVITYKKGGRE
jgi:release factor H-coupled RctB family protein